MTNQLIKTIRNIIPIAAVLFLAELSYSQENKQYLTEAEFKMADISILSATIDSSKIDSSKNARGVQILKFKFIDYGDTTIKYYETDLGKRGFVSKTKFSTFFSGSLRHLSILTVPFKLRSNNKNGYVTAQADVKNVGIHLPFALWNSKRYWLNNNTSQHKFSLGLLLAPMAQQLDNDNTENYFGSSGDSYNALMFSTSIAATYTYNNITIAVIPIGFDFGTDRAGKKWVNHGKYWTGFGLGIDTKLFGF